MVPETNGFETNPSKEMQEWIFKEAQNPASFVFRTKIRDRIELGVLGARFLLTRSEMECCQYPAYCSEVNVFFS